METNIFSNQDVLNELRKLKPQLSQDFHVMRLALFGSFAVGDYNDKSDIDILVDFDRPIGWEFFDLQDFLFERFHRKIDLVSSKALKQQLKDSILNHAIYI